MAPRKLRPAAGKDDAPGERQVLKAGIRGALRPMADMGYHESSYSSLAQLPYLSHFGPACVRTLPREMSLGVSAQQRRGEELSDEELTAIICDHRRVFGRPGKGRRRMSGSMERRHQRRAQ